ncbi:hypothetical protein HDU87_002310 [Geranomyces variabilis]|uniref:PIN domain-containing protein n=1 Tax=Geranomyces variabilis TaxID=109894 RepID=A0AAD5TNT7_9FUNG|nr:hypothetical protein HDU87_002310 [Geranomyces variabilis]
MSEPRSAASAAVVARRTPPKSRRGYLFTKAARGASVPGEALTPNGSRTANSNSESEEECVFSDDGDESALSDTQSESDSDRFEERSLSDSLPSDADGPFDEPILPRAAALADSSLKPRPALCAAKDELPVTTPPPKHTTSQQTPPASTPRARGRGAIGRGMYADSDPRGAYEEGPLYESAPALQQKKRTPVPRAARERTGLSDQGRLFDYRTPSKSPDRPRVVRNERADPRSSPGKASVGRNHRLLLNKHSAVDSVESGVRVKVLHRNAHETACPLSVASVVSTVGDKRIVTSGVPDSIAGAEDVHKIRRPGGDVAYLKDNYRQICAYELDLKERQQTAVRSPPPSTAETLRVENNQRLEFVKRCFTLIEHDYALGVKYDLEARLWKNGVYKGIEQLRHSLQGGRIVLDDDVRDEWLRFLNTTEGLYVQAIAQMKLAWTRKWTGASARPSPIWHRCLNCIGDLLRYKNMYLDNDPRMPLNHKDWSIAAKSYKEASLLSGNADLLPDALHYYLRGLTAKVQFHGAKDALFTLFEANRKRYELDKGIARKYQSGDPTRSRTRLELSFIRLHEIICTKISTEKFPDFMSTFQLHLDNCDQLLMSDSDEDGKLLFQMAAINASMSLVAKFSEPSEEPRDVIKESLVSVTMCILAACVKIVQKSATRGDTIGQSALIYIGTHATTWTSLSALCNMMYIQLSIDVAELDSLAEILDQRGLLPEDWELQGSLTFAQSHYKNPAFDAIKRLPPPDLDDVIREHVSGFKLCMGDPMLCKNRMWRILASARLLAKRSKVLRYNVDDRVFEVRQDTSLNPLPSVQQIAANLTLSDEEIEYEPYEGERRRESGLSDTDGHGEDDEALLTLKALREQLNGAVEARSRMLASQPGKERARFVATGKLIPGKTTVIFDTNIFLHGGKQAEAVIKSRNWVVSIPLVELDGLKTGTDSTSRAAARAVAFLEAEFTGDSTGGDRRKNPMLKLQTSKGNFLHDLSIRTESWTTRVAQHERRRNNDDIILQCCLHFQQQQTRRKGGDVDEVDAAACPVVLVTGDVNMKLKARTLGIAVTDRLAVGGDARGKRQ